MTPVEDALLYLPRVREKSFRARSHLFPVEHDGKPVGLFLVVEGRVKVSVSGADGKETVLDIYGPEDLFGDWPLAIEGNVTAVALEKDCKVLHWPTEQVRDLILREPRLGIGLLDIAAERLLFWQERVRVTVAEFTAARVDWALRHFAERHGERTGAGWIIMPPITHEVLAKFCGTSRELVTARMNSLREEGSILYSRRVIKLLPHFVNHRRLGAIA